MFPKRGTAAVFVTALVLVGLLLYRTPQITVPADPAALMDVAGANGTAVPTLDGSPWPNGWFSGGVDAWSTGGPLAGQTAGPDGTTGTNPGATLAPGATPQAGTVTPPDPTGGSGGSGGSGGGSGGSTPIPPSGPTRAPAPNTTPTPAPAAFTGTVVGSTSSMKYGPVQVKVVYSNGRITDVVALQWPTADSKSLSIAQHALPILRSEALAAQSASINTVSGATYTSDAYKSSLQSAISKAH
jgi:uncharacterized protein with FMN-binding domain